MGEGQEVQSRVMKILAQLPPLVVIAALVAVFFGVTIGVYSLMTRKQRETTREIRDAAEARGWRYRVRRWQGNPAAFQIEGRTGSGMNWILTSGNSNNNQRQWAALLSLRIPMLAGGVDFGIVPRDAQWSGGQMGRVAIPAVAEERIAAFSGTAASALEFLREAQEMPSSVAEFDAAYRILALPEKTGHTLVEASLAEKILRWPAGGAALHSFLAWRDPFGLHCQARLSGPPDWATVTYFLAAAEQLSARIPASSSSPERRGVVDRLVGRFLAS